MLGTQGRRRGLWFPRPETLECAGERLRFIPARQRADAPLERHLRGLSRKLAASNWTSAAGFVSRSRAGSRFAR
jgi:hypothetical protein